MSWDFAIRAGIGKGGGCLKALRELEAKGCFRLSAPRIRKEAPRPRRLSDAVEAPRGVPQQAGRVQGLELSLSSRQEQMRKWNELMIREHPQGAGPLEGRQLRYLVGSEHGWR